MTMNRLSDRLEVRSLVPTTPNGFPPLLFLHGAFVGAWCWGEHFMPWFVKQGFSVHALSFSGHGKSDGADRLHDFSIQDFTNDALEIIEALGVPPIVIGHSMGGFVAQKLMRTIELPGVVLMASVPPTGLLAPAWTLAAFQPSVFWHVGAWQAFGDNDMDPATVQMALFGKKAPDDLGARYQPYMQQESQRAIMDMYGAEINFLPSFTDCPVHVLGAYDDALISSPHVHATAAFHRSSAMIFPDTGHAMMLDATWEDVAGNIDHWLNQNIKRNFRG